MYHFRKKILCQLFTCLSSTSGRETYWLTQLFNYSNNLRSFSIPTQANTPALTPASEDWYSIYLSRRDGRMSWPRCLDYAEHRTHDR